MVGLCRGIIISGLLGWYRISSIQYAGFPASLFFKPTPSGAPPKNDTPKLKTKKQQQLLGSHRRSSGDRLLASQDIFRSQNPVGFSRNQQRDMCQNTSEPETTPKIGLRVILLNFCNPHFIQTNGTLKPRKLDAKFPPKPGRGLPGDAVSSVLPVSVRTFEGDVTLASSNLIVQMASP